MQKVTSQWMLVVSTFVLLFMVPLSQATILYTENFDAATPGQSLTDPPLNWTHVLGDVRVGATPHPGWVGNAVVGALATGAPEFSSGAEAHKAIPSLPTSGVITLTFDAWAYDTENGADIRLQADSTEGVGIQAWRNCCVHNVWTLAASPGFTGGAPLEWHTPSNFMRNVTVHVRLFIDYDHHEFWAQFQDATTTVTTPKFSFVGTPQLTTLRLYTDLRDGSIGADFDNIQVEAVPAAVGGTVTGVSPTKVICKNVTTGQKVTIKDGARSWDCEAAGLVVHPGDIIKQTATGPAD